VLDELRGRRLRGGRQHEDSGALLLEKPLRRCPDLSRVDHLGPTRQWQRFVTESEERQPLVGRQVVPASPKETAPGSDDERSILLMQNAREILGLEPDERTRSLDGLRDCGGMGGGFGHDRELVAA